MACVEGGGCVDGWMQDQLVPFMALADGDGGERSEMLVGELTLHTRTAMWVAERMTGCEFEVERVDGGGGGGEDDAWRGGEEGEGAVTTSGRATAREAACRAGTSSAAEGSDLRIPGGGETRRCPARLTSDSPPTYETTVVLGKR